jgi:hypothetical protein
VDNLSPRYRAQAKGATFMPTYRVSYEIVRRTLYVDVEAGSKNVAAELAVNMERSMINIGKWPEIVIVDVEQYFSAPTKISMA